MIRRRLLGAAVGAGVALAAVPAFAEVDPGGTATSSAEASALRLLERAAHAGRQLTYTGTQYVASWRPGSTSSALVELHHDPERGAVVTDAGQDAPETAATAALDPRMLSLLAASYSLSVSGPGRCAGRSATVITAERDDGAVAGRFWVDRDSGVLLRREVYDSDGRRVRSSAFLDLAVEAAEPRSGAAAATALGGSERPAAEAVERLRADGWHVPERLPNGFRLFETRRSGPVLHLAYTDGLSTLSLFSQTGRLGTRALPGFSADEVGGRPVWVRRAAPERVVWAGGGRVWTLVSDAPEQDLRAAVLALPRDRAPEAGVRARLARGLSRLGGMLNPFG